MTRTITHLDKKTQRKQTSMLLFSYYLPQIFRIISRLVYVSFSLHPKLGLQLTASTGGAVLLRAPTTITLSLDVWYHFRRMPLSLCDSDFNHSIVRCLAVYRSRELQLTRSLCGAATKKKPSCAVREIIRESSKSGMTSTSSRCVSMGPFRSTKQQERYARFIRVVQLE